ncbi:peptidyl-prolyl cis-trans isomerase [Ammoniphilus sp. CFH 90114]|uniref:peptidyl-prolyl cis-trans isomerase n=1 Tax=Ammoniphilus sp. CFH 90114 TaxID=2493665 RepID=UPI00100E257B|nr:peptidyl-prolyl cis-trans isomerase [Ammoniphilus sp. CFH 90114]RXT09024.1 peptidylprolyl isomerase [Ammoniphilus sp. CFH 90114]
MRNIRVLWGIIGSLLLLLGVLGWNYNSLIGAKKIAQVANESITESDWTDELKRIYGKLVLEKMIDRRVVLLQAEQNGVTVTDQEIDSELKKLQDRYVSSESFFGAIRKDMGLAPEELKEELRHYLLLEKLATLDIEVSDQELFRHYEENRANYNQPPLGRISAIYLGDKNEAEQVIAELHKGADFQTLAKERSGEIYSAASGGDLGWVSLLGGDVDQEIVDAALSMKEDQVSEPIAIEKGYVVIKLHKKREAVTRTFDDVKDEIKRELALNQAGSLENVLEKLRKGMDVQIFQKN